jgi:hypothetical protein
MTTATTDILEKKLREEMNSSIKMTVEKIDIINLAEISFNIVKEFRAKEQIQIQDAFDNGQI